MDKSLPWALATKSQVLVRRIEMATGKIPPLSLTR